MSLNYLVSDMLTRIRNAQSARFQHVTCPSSNMLVAILEVLQKEGYIKSYIKYEVRKNIYELKIELKYYNGKPVINMLKTISTPGRRMYSSVKQLQKFYNGLGISILSTAKGVLSDHDARLQNVGGEVLCQVF